MQIGLLGKANVGKSTFFSAATETTAQTGNFPFTTIEPNVGVTHVKVDCACKNLESRCGNNLCVNGTRFIAVKLIDVAGLVPGANEGKGLGNQFLTDAMQADALIHVVDISHASFQEHMDSVNKILEEIDGQNKPTVVVFNKIDKYKREEYDETDLINEYSEKNFTLEEWKNTWISKLGKNVIFISATKKTNIDEFKKIVYREVRKIHIKRYPYNNFLYPDIDKFDVI